MNQKIYNALRQLNGYAKIDAGDGFIFKVWFDWGNQPYADLSDCEDDRLISMSFKCVLDKTLFEKSNYTEGYRREDIALTMIKSINGTPIEERIAA